MADETPSRLRFWVYAVSVLALAGAAVQHQVHFWRWYIEDAAISFAYARNWADGHGLVPTPDAERLEGYSNFTWVVLLALGELLGFDSFDSSKWMQVVLGFLTVPLTALLAREASDDRTSGAPIVAAAYLATASSFAIWGACGLENGLFNFLMAAALLRSAIELRTEARTPWSALLWFLLAISRPEAILYCAVAGFLMMVFTLRRGLAPTLKWLGLFFVPFVAYHVVRFNYFAWEFPQTYYGKMNTKEPTPLKWSRRGWKQVRGWSHTLWTGYYLPIWFIGLVGWRGAKGLVTLALLAGAGCWLLLPEIIPTEPLVLGAYEIAPLLLPQDFPDWWEDGRSYLMVFCAAFLPILAVGHRRGWVAWSIAIGLWGIAPLALGLAFFGTTLGAWIVLSVLPALLIMVWQLGPTLLHDPPPMAVQVRVLCWGVASGVFFFAIYTQGDWMKAWRWMSLLQVPIAVAFANGVLQLADAVETATERLRRRLSTDLDPRLPGSAVWSVGLLVAVSLVVFNERRFSLGLEWGLGIAGVALVLALLLGLLRSRLHTSWTPAGWSVALLLAALTAFPNLDYSDSLHQRPETGPFSVKKRVDFVAGLREKLELEHRIIDLDVDMGAHLWWGRDTFRMMDLAGLVDIPFAQHRFKRAFVKEYVFEEMRPHFAHVHGGWASNSRIKTHAEWRRDYVEIPGFPAGSRSLHIGNFLRRELIFAKTYPGEPTELDDGVIFHGFQVPSAPGANRTLWLEVAVQDTRRRSAGAPLNLLVLVAKEGELEQTFSVPMGHNWVQAQDWKEDEIFLGRFHLSTRGLQPGTHDLGFVLYAQDAPLLPIDGLPEVPAGETPPSYLFAPGEVVFEGALQILPADQAVVEAKKDLETSLAHADADRCEDAHSSWLDARRHVPIKKTFREEHQPGVHARIATCWARRAQTADDPVPALIEARLWNHEDELYRELRGPIAAEWMEHGKQARAKQDWESAYQSFRTVLQIDPTWSWARRWAEEARFHRLKLDGADKKGR